MNHDFHDTFGGLVVAYLYLADQLGRALVTYACSAGQGECRRYNAERRGGKRRPYG